MLLTPQFLNILTWKRASRHSGVQFLISPLTTYLRTRRFNEPTFRLTGHTDHWKTQHFATSLPFGAGDSPFFWLSRNCIFFLLTLLHLMTLLHLICFSSAFSTFHIVGSLLFKLPSTTLYYRVLLQYYSVLQSTTPVLLCTTKYYSSTTLYYKVLVHYYSVLQSTSPVLQSTTPVLRCTTKYYSSTTLYYKALLQYYSVLQSTTL